MASLTTKNFTSLVQEWAAVCQTAVSVVYPAISLNFTKGSILRALAESQASVSLWLQGLTLNLLTVTRLATSQGSDVDSFVNDFNMTRLPGSVSTGIVTFSRIIPTNPAVIPVGALVQTSDGSQQFQVYADPTNTAYSANAGGPGVPGYRLPAQVTSLNVPVENTIPGSVGNVQPNSITLIQTGMSGIDSVTNEAAFTNGFDVESDAAVRTRFILYINSLAKGTEGAIGYAITSVQQGLQYQIIENAPPALAYPPPASYPNPMAYGYPPSVLVYVDDGSGALPPTTLAAAAAAVNAYRAAGVSVGVFAATTLVGYVTMTIQTATGFLHPTVVAQVTAAIAAYINGIGLGNTLPYSGVSAVAMGIPGVTSVSAYTLNNGTVDVVPGPGQTIKAGVLAIS